MNRRNAVAAILAASTLGFAAPSAAADAFRVDTGNAVSACQGALPAYEGALRKRPLALANEGASTAFVTCALRTGGRVTAVYLYARAAGPATTLQCTAVAGHQGNHTFSSTRTIPLPGNDGQGSTSWQAGAFGWPGPEFNSSIVSISCALPPGAAINDIVQHFREDVGQ